MDKELIDYIIAHYSHLLSFEEKAAQKHLFATEKADKFESQGLKTRILNDLGTKNKEYLSILDKGYDEFKRIAVDKLLKQHKGKIFINRCRRCGRLARTPLAKQCRYCEHDWHDANVTL